MTNEDEDAYLAQVSREDFADWLRHAIRVLDEGADPAPPRG